MAKSLKSPSILIVGGGPTGLVLALGLLRNGISVRIIEKATSQRIGQRGASILPRSLELFGLLGILPEIERLGHFSPTCCIYDNSGNPEPLHMFELSPFVKPTSSIPNPNIILLGQDSLESILRAELEKYGVHVEYGRELIAFEQHECCITASIKNVKEGMIVEEIEYEWLVGTDGARGVVRKLLGCTFLGTTRNMENLFVGDIQVENLDRRYWHMWGDVTTTLISLRPTEHKNKNLYSLLMAGKNVDMASVSHSYDELIKTFRANTNRHDIKFGALEWASHYRPNIRMVDKLHQHRVLIAGDAAHVHSPTGGQSMNTGIQDSFNLGWKLALVHKKLAPMSLLNSYDEERLPVISEMLNQTTLLLEKSFQGNSTLKEGQSAWHCGNELHQLTVNCRWSSILFDETMPARPNDVVNSYAVALDGLIHAGDRAPDATDLAIVSSKPENRHVYTRLFWLFSCARHTALVFADSSDHYTPILKHLARYKEIVVSVVILPENSAMVRKLGMQSLSDEEKLSRASGPELLPIFVEDEEGHAYSAYGIKAKTLRIIVVRPDGTIGAIVSSPVGCHKYFAQLFGKEMVETP